MVFELDGTAVKLQGPRLFKSEAVSRRTLQKMVASNTEGSLFQLRVVEDIELSPKE